MDAATLSRAMGGSLSMSRYQAYAADFTAAAARARCSSVNRMAMWCAQIGHESVGLRYTWPVKNICSVAGCEKVHYGRGLCRFHYDRMRWRGTTDAPERLVPNKGKTCVQAGCERPAKCKGRCEPHYRRLLKFGNSSAGGTIRTRRDHSKVPSNQRWCTRCDQMLPAAAFAKGQRWCRDCRRMYYTANAAVVLARNARSARAKYEEAKNEGRCSWRGGHGCRNEAEPGYVHCGRHRAQDAYRHSRDFTRHYEEHDLTSCWLCGGDFTDADRLQHDHLIPKSLGGPDEPWNRAPAHRSCNNRRRNMPLAETVDKWHPNGLQGPIAALVEVALRKGP